jgi:hypothetical protein
MITYDQFLKLAEKFNASPETYLPKYFKEIDDEFEMTTQAIGEKVDKSEITIRKWFQKGKIKPQKKRPWIALGIDVKRAMFIELYPYIRERLKVLGWYDESNIEIYFKSIDPNIEE